MFFYGVLIFSVVYLHGSVEKVSTSLRENTKAVNQLIVQDAQIYSVQAEITRDQEILKNIASRVLALEKAK